MYNSSKGNVTPFQCSYSNETYEYMSEAFKQNNDYVGTNMFPNEIIPNYGIEATIVVFQSLIIT